MQKQKTRPSTVTHKKRQGAHHRQSKPYLKVYWPYVPMLLVVAGGLLLNSWLGRSQVHGVLSYATEISSQKLLETTNVQRSSDGKAALQINDQLTAAAQTKANDMATRNYWSHTTPDGSAPWVFIQKAGYSYQKAGENLAYGFNSSSDTVAGWMNSKSHRENLLDPAYSEVGFGYANVANFNKSGPETVVVAMYGEPQTAGSPAAAKPVSLTPTSSGAPVTSNASKFTEPATLAVSRIQSLTGGSAPWVTFVIGLISGAGVLYVLFKHGKAFKRTLIHGEEFFLHHPLMDVLAVSFIMAGYLLSQTAGMIR